ncbi:formamidopyrimidine-DNA glycosylase isoform X2 [Gossypium raimondii]|uniref:formamidopyrimidine-DNA glycosylase isoform X2 n=1 Tax=Gossypium raimondii TaxID=29730 RepID=UPI00063AE46C|nr:formamidopyrimidine-DNA glycosylase isoform X2 [Gossypium raimondii]
MPELPEVEAARRAIEENCLGKKIKRAIIANDSKVIEGVSSLDFESALLGKTIVSAHRKGKNLWLHLDSPPFPSFQFGMAGAIYIKGVAVTKYKRSAVKDNDEWPSKYSKFFVELDDGLELSFTDKRRFARVRLLKDPTSVPPISELGPDALFEPMTINEFTDSLSKKKIGIKALLLDQSYISGIGNWIADEVLYQARIHPLQICSSLSKENCATLHNCIKEVIQYAVEVDADCNRFPCDWLFHFRWGKKSGKIKGKKIDFINAGGRTSAYVPDLQKLSGTVATKAAGKPRKQASKKKGGDEAEDNDGDEDGVGDEPTNEEEESTKITKPKKGGNPRGRGKKPPMKRKAKESDDDDDDDSGGNNDVSSEEDDEDPTEKGRKVKTNTSNKQAKTVKTSKRAVSSQDGKKPKRAK